MKITSQIFRRKSKHKNSKGKKDHRLGKFVLRIKYEDLDTGKIKTVERQFDSESDALVERPKLEAKIRETSGKIFEGEKMVFADLVVVCRRRFYKPAVIRGGRKTDGIRSYKTVDGFLRTLSEFFGEMPINKIRPHHLKDYRTWRYDVGSRRGKSNGFVPITHSSINRELAAMRRMMKHAVHEGWLTQDIFAGFAAIDHGAEVPRARILSRDEELALLNSCRGERKVTYTRKWKGREQTITRVVRTNSPLLKAIVMLAIDSSMRKGEILGLRWHDIDFDRGVITVLGTHTKTQQTRLAPLSRRVALELLGIRDATATSTDIVFPIADFKRSWETAKKLAGIEGLTFHDLRRTAISLNQNDGVTQGIAGKIAGHASTETTARHYTALDLDIVRGVKAVIDERNNKYLN